MKKIYGILSLYFSVFFTIFIMVSSLAAVPNSSGSCLNKFDERTNIGEKVSKEKNVLTSLMDKEDAFQSLILGPFFVIILIALIISIIITVGIEWIFCFFEYMDNNFPSAVADFVYDHTLVLFFLFLFHPASWFCLIKVIVGHTDRFSGGLTEYFPLSS